MEEVTIKRTPMELAIARKIGSDVANIRRELAAYQLLKLRETLLTHLCTALFIATS